MKKGFTLVELLAVIALLSVILGIATFSAVKYYNQRKEIDYNNIASLIVDNTKVLVNTNKTISKKVDYNLRNSHSCKLGYDVLVDNRLMDKDTKNPKTGEVLYGNNKYIRIKLNTTTYEYSYKYDAANVGNLTDCLSEIQE